jgi:hypothetical protein
MGVPARKGGLWKKSSVINILKNEHYIGKIVIRKHIDVKQVTDQEIVTRCMFNEDYEVVDGKHPAIIDEDTFNMAQHSIRRIISTKPSAILKNPYASILKCECGRTMLRKPNRNAFRYHCDEQMFCGNASVSEEILTEAIIRELKKALDNFFVSASDSREEEKKIKRHTEYVSMLEAKVVDLEKKELSIWEKYTEDKMPKDIFDKILAKCLEEKKSVELSLKEAYTDTPKQTDHTAFIVSLHEAIDALSDSTVSAADKNKLLSAVVERIVYRRPKAIKMSKEEAEAKGVTLAGGWYCPDFHIDIKLKY